jgi:hypothetical protein
MGEGITDSLKDAIFFPLSSLPSCEGEISVSAMSERSQHF